MIRNAQVGERVIVIDKITKQPVLRGGMSGQIGDEPWSVWEFEKGNTGTVVEVRDYQTQKNKWVVVAPDPPNTGTHTFTPSDLRRIK